MRRWDEQRGLEFSLLKVVTSISEKPAEFRLRAGKGSMSTVGNLSPQISISDGLRYQLVPKN